MKTTNSTLTAANRSINLPDLEKVNKPLTEATGTAISYKSIFFIVLFAGAAATAILLACDHIAEYGWAAFCAAVALYAVGGLLSNCNVTENEA